jgi:uncharacterized cupredoxin-like copper-binding protein
MKRMSMRGAGASTVAAVSAALALGACGGEEETTTGAATAPSGPATASGDVTIDAREYAFDGVPQTIEAGKTSFTLNNVGQEEHELFIARINEGYTFDEAIAEEGEKGTAEEIGGIRPVKPGEESKPFETNLKPGNYGMLCFVPGPEGQPHFTLGQRAEFSVE